MGSRAEKAVSLITIALQFNAQGGRLQIVPLANTPKNDLLLKVEKVLWSYNRKPPIRQDKRFEDGYYVD